MTKLLFSILFLFVLSMHSISAQEDKLLVGGVFGTSFTNDNFKNSSSKNTDFDLSTSMVFGYFLSPDLTIGSELSITNSVSKSEPVNSKTFSFDLMISPLVRYYINDLFFQLQLNAGKSTVKYDIDIYFNGVLEEHHYKNNYNIIGGALSLGYDIKLSERIFIEPQLRYRMNGYKAKLESQADYTKSGIMFYAGLIYRW